MRTRLTQFRLPKSSSQKVRRELKAEAIKPSRVNNRKAKTKKVARLLYHSTATATAETKTKTNIYNENNRSSWLLENIERKRDLFYDVREERDVDGDSEDSHDDDGNYDDENKPEKEGDSDDEEYFREYEYAHN